MKRVRLVKVFVKPVVMVDDGDKLEEFDQPTIEIPADEWPTYSNDRFPREIKEWEDRLNESENNDSDAK